MIVVEFKAKIFAERYVKVPKFGRRHVVECTGHGNSYLNSDLLPNILNHGQRALLDVDNPPDNVSINKSGFLAVIKITLKNKWCGE